MLLSLVRSSLKPSNCLLSYKFCQQSDPDFQKQLKSKVTAENVTQMIDNMVKSNDVLLFMKGTPQYPQCGYSNTVVKILQGLGVKDIKGVNILSDIILRDQVKIYSNWPTYPQLYIKGKFVGGCDIVREMAASGDLKTLLADNQVI